MKERLILFCMLLLCGIGVNRAQSGNAKDFDQKEEAIVQKLQQAVNEKNYKEAEKNGKALITLFKEQDEYLQPIITQYFIDNKSEIWLLFLIAHSKR